MAEQKVVFMHGFTREEISRIMKGVRSVVQDPSSVAFCMSTQNNMDWKIKDLIKDVLEEHEYLKKNPPGGAPSGAVAPGGEPPGGEASGGAPPGAVAPG